MSQDVKLKGDDGEAYSYYTIAGGHSILGRSAGWKEACVWLMRLGSAAFEAGDDKRAELLRKLSRDASVKSDEAAAEYDAFEKERAPDRYARRMKALGRKE